MVVAVEVAAGGEWGKNVLMVALLGCVSEMPPLVVKEGGFAFPLCPSGLAWARGGRCFHGAMGVSPAQSS